MKRAILTAVIAFSLVPSASAGHKDGNRNQNQGNGNQSEANGNRKSNFRKHSRKPDSNQDFGGNIVNTQGQKTKNIRPSWNAPKEAFATTNGKKHELKARKHDGSPKLRPLSGDGRVLTPEPTSEATLVMPVTSVPQGQGPKGYVWNNGHWERASANGNSASTTGAPMNATVEIRNHKPTGGATGQGDTSGGSGVKPPPVGSNNHVQVTVSEPVVLTGQTVYGSGIGVKEIVGGIITIHNPKTHIDILPPWGFEAAPAVDRDHRSPVKHQK